MKSDLYRGLTETELRERCDESCKRLLSNKEIIARILQHTVEEFFLLDAEFIRDRCIEQNNIYHNQERSPNVKPIYHNQESSPDVKLIYHNQGRSSDEKREYIPERITGRNGNSSIVGEGEFGFDVHFDALMPGETGFEKALFDLEGQNRYNPGYILETRGIYYACRMISTQYGREFSDSHYDDVKKVYSIWICMNPQVADINTVTTYSFCKKDIVGHSVERKHAYDKITIIKICLGGNNAQKHENYTGVIRMLDVVFSNELSADSKAEILTEEFGIPMEDIEGEVKDMCDISQFYYESGFDKGVSQGIKALILDNLEEGKTKETIILKIIKNFSLSEKEANEYFTIYAGGVA